MTDYSGLKRLAEAADKGRQEGNPSWVSAAHLESALDISIDTLEATADFIAAANPAAVLALLNELDNFKAACTEWIGKTDWVQTSAQPKELGMHRADVLRQRILALIAERDQLKAEVVRLRSDNESWRLTVDTERRFNRTITEELERLKGPEFTTELALLRRDAERYRWLRNGTSQGKVDICIVRCDWTNSSKRILEEGVADCALDSAMSKASGQ